MHARARLLTTVALILCVLVAHADILTAQQPRPKQPPRPSSPQRIGVQGFGIAGVSWPIAKESFEASGLDAQSLEIGGGGQVTNLWRRLFVEVSASRWSNEGERVFVNESGDRFPLGIPLDVKATYVDASAGWKFPGEGLVTYFGGGAGVVKYSEQSPFALSGDDLDTRATSYHVLVGVEVPLKTWLAISGDFRYRFVPDLLGDGGVSGVLEEDRFGGPQLGIGLRLTFGGSPPPVVKRPAPPPPGAKEPKIQEPPTKRPGTGTGMIVERAPVFLLPDATRKPLRMLEPGTTLRILQQTDEWVRVEFQDSQFGPRQGYVQRKYVRLPK